MAVSDYSTTPGDNTEISGIPVSDSTVINQLDNIVRQVMADVKSFYDSTITTTQIGVTIQAYDADLTAIAALTSAANKLPYATGSGVWALTDFSAAGRALVDDASASAQRTTLGLGTAAVATLIDDDTLATAAADNLASAESIKAYVDGAIPVVLDEIASNSSAGGVGTYAFARPTTAATIAFGDTRAGSALEPTGALTEVGGTGGITISSPSLDAGAGSVLSGTWRCMGYNTFQTGTGSDSGKSNRFATLWLRIV